MPIRRVGLISDTHGLVRPAVFDVFAGVEVILHAGDVGRGVLEELGTIAPVRAVAGNTDPPGEPGLPEAVDLAIDGVRVHVSHGHELGSPRPEELLKAYDADVIVYGHTHRQLVHRVGARWVVNPGAAGERRFNLPPSAGLLLIENGDVSVKLVALD